MLDCLDLSVGILSFLCTFHSCYWTQVKRWPQKQCVWTISMCCWCSKGSNFLSWLGFCPLRVSNVILLLKKKKCWRKIRTIIVILDPASVTMKSEVWIHRNYGKIEGVSRSAIGYIHTGLIKQQISEISVVWTSCLRSQVVWKNCLRDFSSNGQGPSGLDTGRIKQTLTYHSAFPFPSMFVWRITVLLEKEVYPQKFACLFYCSIKKCILYLLSVFSSGHAKAETP